jgi:transcriptional regulator with XRE-family HTH domain
MSLPGVAKIEQGGVTDPHYSTLQKLADALNVDPRWLITGEEVEEAAVPLAAAPPGSGRAREEVAAGVGDENEEARRRFVETFTREHRVELIAGLARIFETMQRLCDEDAAGYSNSTELHLRADAADRERTALMDHAQELGLLAYAYSAAAGEFVTTEEERTASRRLDDALVEASAAVVRLRKRARSAILTSPNLAEGSFLRAVG